MAKAWEDGPDDTVAKGYPWTCKTVFQQTPGYVQVDSSPLRPLPHELIDGEGNDDLCPERSAEQRRMVSSLIRHYFRGQQLFISSARPPPTSLIGNLEWTIRSSTQRQYILPTGDFQASHDPEEFVEVEDDWEVLRRRREERAKMVDEMAKRKAQRAPLSRRDRSDASRLESSENCFDLSTQVESVAACSGCKSAKPSRRNDVLAAVLESEPPLASVSELQKDGTQHNEEEALSGGYFAVDDSVDVGAAGNVPALDCKDKSSNEAKSVTIEPVRISRERDTPMAPQDTANGWSEAALDQVPQPDTKDGGISATTKGMSPHDIPRVARPQEYTTAPAHLDSTPFLYRKAGKNAWPESSKGPNSCPTTVVNNKPKRQRRRVTFSSQNTGGPPLMAEPLDSVALPRLEWSVGDKSSFAKNLNLALNQNPNPQTPVTKMPLVEAHLNSVLTPVEISHVSLKHALISEMRRSGAIISGTSPALRLGDGPDRRASSFPEPRNDANYEDERGSPVVESQAWPGTQMLLAQAHQNLFDSPMGGLQSVTPARVQQNQLNAGTPDRTPLRVIEFNQQLQTQSADTQWSPWSTIKKPSRPAAGPAGSIDTPIDALKPNNSRTKSRLYQSVSASTPSSPHASQNSNGEKMLGSFQHPTSSAPNQPNSSSRLTSLAQGQEQAESHSPVVSASLLLSTEDSWELDQTIGEVSEYLFGTTRDIESVLATGRSVGYE